MVLPAILDLPAAAPLLKECQVALAKGEGLVVDATQVGKVTTPCLQVLASAKRAFALTGGPAMQFAAVSPAFAEAARGLKLDGLLEIEKDIA